MPSDDAEVYGRFDEQGSPRVSFHLCGVAHDPPGIEYEGPVDTGFSGFIQLPIFEAFALNLPLEGTASVILADGEAVSVLTALGRASFAGNTVVGTIHLSMSDEILIGMEFLRAFDYGLGVFKDSVVLIPED